jgi:hypothetical protein
MGVPPESRDSAAALSFGYAPFDLLDVYHEIFRPIKLLPENKLEDPVCGVSILSE